MSISKSLVVAVAFVITGAASVHAQGVVPGGWAAQFGYQSFGVVAPGGGAVAFGGQPIGIPGFGLPGFSGSYGPVGYNPYAIAQQSSNFMAVPIGSPPQVMSGMGPLMQGIRQSARSNNGSTRPRRPR